jgi:hypothetical protein
MPLKNIDYTRTIIYKIICNDIKITDLYVGSTTDFRKRKGHHKSKCNNIIGKGYNSKIYKTIRNNGGWDNWTMIEIEKFPCTDGNEARARERYYFDLLNASLNTVRPLIYEHEKHEIDKKNAEKKKILTLFFENLIDEKKVFDYKIKASDLFTTFQAFIKDGNFKNEITLTRFGIDIQDYERIKKIKTHKGAFYCIDFDITKTYKITNVPILALFFENLINGKKVFDYKIKASDLFTKFQAFIKDGNFKNEITLTRFGIDIKEYEGILKMKTMKGAFYCINVDIIKKFLTTKYNMIFESVDRS